MAARIAGLSLILLGAATILAYAFQRALIYYPQTAEFTALEPRAARQGLLPWLDAKGSFVGWRSQRGAGIPLLLLHGNAGHAMHRSYFVSRLRDASVTPPIFILEYPGYGARPGTPTEDDLVAAAVEAIDLLGQPLILAGESLGSGVACAAASQRPSSVRGLLLITPFDSLVTVAKVHYPWAPVGLILKDRYDSSRALENLRAPLAVIVADGDFVIPVDSAIKLFASYLGPKKLWRVAGSGHNEVLQDISDSELRAAYQFACDR
ncbi:MAG TPA: alpha/beta fold hydrolase [Terrimicrobiaceae bacterium]